MSKEPDCDAPWKPCAPGTLQGYGRTAKADQRRHLTVRAAGASLLVVLCIGLAIWSADRLGGPQEYYFGGIACSEVQANIEAYAMGTLPQPLAARIRTHLGECPCCPRLIQKMQQTQASVAFAPATERDRLHIRVPRDALATVVFGSVNTIPGLPIRLALARAR